jgi:hypothetical protein
MVLGNKFLGSFIGIPSDIYVKRNANKQSDNYKRDLFSQC